VRVIRDYLDKTYPRCAFIRVGNLAQEGYGSADFSALL